MDKAQPSELVEKLRSLPVRTLVVNVDTGETGNQSVELPLELRDALIERLTPTPEPCRLREALVEARRAMQPFASHIGKDGELVKLIVGKNSWTRTLFTEDFARLREAIAKIDSALSASPAEPEEATEAWQPIETAPKDGREVWVKRVHDGRTVKEGWAVFSSLSTSAPMRQWADGGMDEPIPPDHDAADVKRWCNPDRLHRFPTPTHWMSEPPAMHSAAPIGGK